MSLPALKLVGGEIAETTKPQGGQWLSLAEASSRCGDKVSALRAKCLRGWGAAGLARKQLTDTGEAWFVHESADPAFRGVQLVEHVNAAFDMGSVSGKQRETILFRERCVLQVESIRSQQHRLGMPVAQLIKLVANAINGDRKNPPLQKVSARSLERWYTAYFRGPENTRGRAGLVDKRLDKPQADDRESNRAFFALFDNWYLDQGEPKIRNCYRLACMEAGRQGLTSLPSLSTTQRHAAAIPADQLILARKGPKMHDDKCAAFIQRDYTRIKVPGDGGVPVVREFRADDIWNCDHHICDVIVRDGVDANGKPKFIRPWLTPWMDMRSRKIVGYRFSRQAPDSATVLLAFRDAALRAGHAVPRWVYIDNGKDFDAWFLQGQTKVERRKKIIHEATAFSGVFGVLQVGVTHAIPYNAKAKPIERWFGTFEDQFGRLQKTYCGRSPQHKPERLPDVLKGKQVPTFEQFVNEASAWIDDVYHLQGHTGHGMEGHSPNEVYDATRHTLRLVSEADLSICLVKVTEAKTIGLRGVQYGKLFYGVGDPMLMQFKGQKVHLFIDPDDVREARVFSETLVYLCTVQCNELMPHSIVSHEQLRNTMAEMKRINRTTKQALASGLRIHTSPVELLAEQALADAQARDPISAPGGPPTIEMINTGIDMSLSNNQSPFGQAADGQHQSQSQKSWLQELGEDD